MTVVVNGTDQSVVNVRLVLALCFFSACRLRQHVELTVFNCWNVFLVCLQMKKQLEDVVHVAVVNILSSGNEAKKNYVERDLMLAKVSTASKSIRGKPVLINTNANPV